MTVADPACPMCGSQTSAAGVKKSALRAYHLRTCETCGFSYVADPDTAKPYDDGYYRGKGADRFVDYVFDADHPGATVRELEWRGTYAIVSSCKAIGAETRWLDYGCGTGGFLRWLAKNAPVSSAGYDVGRGAELARERGVDVLDDAGLAAAGPFDVVTAIEVLEHLVDPQRTIDRIASLLAPGGLFFYTTGNAARHRGSLAAWSYVVPQIHIAFFEPRTMERALRAAGLVPAPVSWSRGFSDVVAYKILKNLGVHRKSSPLTVLPWQCVTAVVDRLFGISAFPAGVKPGGHCESGTTTPSRADA